MQICELFSKYLRIFRTLPVRRDCGQSPKFCYLRIHYHYTKISYSRPLQVYFICQQYQHFLILYNQTHSNVYIWICVCTSVRVMKNIKGFNLITPIDIHKSIYVIKFIHIYQRKDQLIVLKTIHTYKYYVEKVSSIN